MSWLEVAAIAMGYFVVGLFCGGAYFRGSGRRELVWGATICFVAWPVALAYALIEIPFEALGRQDAARIDAREGRR